MLKKTHLIHSDSSFKLFFLFFFILSVLFTFPGCVSMGPVYKPGFTPKESKKNLKNRKVVVSRFFLTGYYQTEWVTRETYGYSTLNIKTETTGQDISSSIADLLNSNGISARAAKDITPDQIGQGEILLSGVIGTSGKTELPVSRVPCFFILVGNLLPNPMGFESGANISYRYEIVDSRRNILLQTGGGTEIIYTDYWVWGFLAQRSSNYQKGRSEAMKGISSEIVHMLRD